MDAVNECVTPCKEVQSAGGRAAVRAQLMLISTYTWQLWHCPKPNASTVIFKALLQVEVGSAGSHAPSVQLACQSCSECASPVLPGEPVTRNKPSKQ